MTKTPNSSVAEPVNPATVPSNKSAKTTPQPESDVEEVNFADLLGQMGNYELIQIGLVVMALLHKRAEEADGPSK